MEKENMVFPAMPSSINHVEFPM